MCAARRQDLKKTENITESPEVLFVQYMRFGSGGSKILN